MAGNATDGGGVGVTYVRRRNWWSAGGRVSQITMSLGVLGMYGHAVALLVASPFALAALVLVGLELRRPGALEVGVGGVTVVRASWRRPVRIDWGGDTCGPFRASDDQRSVASIEDGADGWPAFTGPWVGVSASEVATVLNRWRSDALAARAEAAPRPGG